MSSAPSPTRSYPFLSAASRSRERMRLKWSRTARLMNAERLSFAHRAARSVASSSFPSMTIRIVFTG